MSWDPPDDPEELRAIQEADALRRAQRLPTFNPYDEETASLFLWMAATDLDNSQWNEPNELFTLAQLLDQYAGIVAPDGFDEATVLRVLARHDDIVCYNGIYRRKECDEY